MKLMLQALIDWQEGTHVFFCKRGGHYGVCWGLLSECPCGCSRGFYEIVTWS